jgi:hypothetical protein
MAIVTIIQAILGKLAADEIKAWLPILNQRILNFAVSRLPEEKRKRYVEEWEAHSMDIPGDFSKLAYSADQVRAALNMAWIDRTDSTPSTMYKVKRCIMSRQRDIAWSISNTIAVVGWLYLPKLAGFKAGDRFIFERHARYPRLYQIVNAGPERGECPLWLSCVVTTSLTLNSVSMKWLKSVNRKLLDS